MFFMTMLTFRVINLFFMIILIFYKRKEPALLLAWLLLLIFLPPIGCVMYLLFERAPLSNKKGLFLNEYQDVRQGREGGLLFNERIHSLIHFNEIYNGSRLYQFQDFMYFVDGKSKYQQLFKDIESATHSIHVQYFIIRKDEVGRQFIDLLAQKAANGVEVRLIFDSAGCFGTRLKYFDALVQAGGHVYQFHPPALGLIGLNYNYRNHRKIVVIDGRIGYLGGMNIGKEYMSLDPKFSPWRDAHLRLVGDAVWELQHRFLKDYEMVCQNKEDEQYLKANINGYFTSPLSTTLCPMQIISDGPDTTTDDIKLTLVKMIQSATCSVKIQTPYFIPDMLFLETLKIASYSGVKVEVMIPTIADHHYVYRTTTSFIKELREANIDVYFYEGFLHSKVIIIDEQVCTIGSTNIDQRSFKINYEINAFIYDQQLTNQVVAQFKKDLENSWLADDSYEQNKPVWVRFEEKVYRLVSMLL